MIRNTGTPVLYSLQTSSETLNEHRPSAFDDSYYMLNSMISNFTGVEISDFTNNKITFSLTITGSGDGKLQYLLNVEFEPFNNCKIRNVSVRSSFFKVVSLQIVPEFPIADITEASKQEDTQFLISEVINRLRNHAAINAEIDAIRPQYARHLTHAHCHHWLHFCAGPTNLLA